MFDVTLLEIYCFHSIHLTCRYLRRLHGFSPVARSIGELASEDCVNLCQFKVCVLFVLAHWMAFDH